MMKKVIHFLHLWLGLASGLVVFILAVTGCIYAFQEEIQNATQSYRYVEPQKKPFLPPSAFQTIAEKTLPGKKVHSVQYADSKTAAVITYFSFAPEEYYYLAYANPYTGEVLKVKNMDSDFFRFILCWSDRLCRGSNRLCGGRCGHGGKIVRSGETVRK